MNIQRIAAFSHGTEGGNPAGVVIADTLPEAADMQRIAAEVGYSETAFATPQGDGFRVRYFAPDMEVPFCGHATIALGAALGAAYGAKSYPLILNEAEITVRAYREGEQWGAELTSPPTSHAAPGRDVLRDVLDLFALTASDLDQSLPPMLVHGGAPHLVVPLASRARLSEIAYDQPTGAAIMRAAGLVTINLIHRDAEGTIHSRNAFAAGGVYEDAATGAAAAALAGWLRDTGRWTAPLSIHQGDDMGVPSRLTTSPLPAKGAGVRVRGLARSI
ncbi:PhzF family phenazine biosynthesis protein [Rubricella aquisinus]|uniref:PhzF family phenazine biosynthesis protein n=1 Tax=Rubricella aquisinus TaxID=2028108 RepID=A0A840WQS5_9RHOB|nr:PhzF family phenazine biosynthesis protein [Rubricella aquisinus]MBB5516393.1 PhzF family phenazine biosynthesis protein [Rubricella aquisinus]